jgi:hypothetical protein
MAQWLSNISHIEPLGAQPVWQSAESRERECEWERRLNNIAQSAPESFRSVCARVHFRGAFSSAPSCNYLPVVRILFSATNCRTQRERSWCGGVRSFQWAPAAPSNIVSTQFAAVIADIRHNERPEPSILFIFHRLVTFAKRVFKSTHLDGVKYLPWMGEFLLRSWKVLYEKRTLK